MVRLSQYVHQRCGSQRTRFRSVLTTCSIRKILALRWETYSGLFFRRVVGANSAFQIPHSVHSALRIPHSVDSVQSKDGSFRERLQSGYL